MVILMTYKGEFNFASTFSGYFAVYLGGGWTNPSEKYARQILSFPQIGVNIEKNKVLGIRGQ